MFKVGGCTACMSVNWRLPAPFLTAAIVADQNAKLSIFATRPAIYTPVRVWAGREGATAVG